MGSLLPSSDPPDLPGEHSARAPLTEASLPCNSLEELYDACGGAVYRLALRLSRSSQEAEDLSHDVFLRFWQQGRYEPSRGPVLAYLLLLTRSMAINRLNQRKNRWQLMQRWSAQLMPSTGRNPQEAAQLEQRLQPIVTNLEAVNRRLPLRAMDSGGRAGGEVLVTANPSHNLLVLDGLPPLPPDKTYRLWAKVNGREVGCVPFLPDSRGHVAMPIPASPTSQASSVSVSVETVPDGQAPRGPMVLTGAI